MNTTAKTIKSASKSVRPSDKQTIMSIYEQLREGNFAQRASDWRNGPIIYQILVDRFAPSPKLEHKKALYAHPRTLRNWNELPERGKFLEKEGLWSHELEFWGGDLAAIKEKLDYIEELGVDAVYLNPIFESLTNHKYDTSNYNIVDEAYGSRKELADLAAAIHNRGMKLILDGVFNHVGFHNPMFQEALFKRNAKWRSWFKFADNKSDKYTAWRNVANLPELNLENQAVRAYIFESPDSVVQSYLKHENIDGWRLDVAFELGFQYLADLTRAAHSAKPESLIVGEIWNYPEEWRFGVDGIMNMHGRKLILAMLEGSISPSLCARLWDTMINDAGIEYILKCWLVLDNHDTPRLSNMLPHKWQRKAARILQFTLPGAVCLYYGSELGMTGGEDPCQRAPMRWESLDEKNPVLLFHKKLLKIRKNEPALRYGNFRLLHSDKLFAFMRRTNSVRETITVLLNPTARSVKETLQLRESKFQDTTPLKDMLSNTTFTVFSGTVDVKVPAHTAYILKADTAPTSGGYDRYSRIY